MQLCRTLQHLMFVKQSGLLDYSLWHSCYKDLQNMYSVLSYHHYHIMFNIYMYLYFSGWGLIGNCFFFLNISSSERGQILEGTAHQDGEERYAELINQVITQFKTPLLLTFVDFSWKVCSLLQLVFWLQILPF